MRRSQRIGFWIGLAVFALILIFPAPEGLTLPAWQVLALLALMVIWWVTEALPIGATSLLPLVIAPLLGIAAFSAAAAPYAHPVILLLMGGFMLGKSIERWNLHERLALMVLCRVGGRPAALIAGFMAVAALMSMWISNTASVIMLLPIVLSVAASAGFEGDAGRNFTLAALLGTAWAASIGGLGTPVGTPPNLIIIGMLEEMGDTRLSFARWMSFGLPAVAVMVPLAFFVLVKWGPKLPAKASASARDVLDQKLAAIGAWSVPEKRLAMCFALIASAWVFRRPLSGIEILGHMPLSGLSDPLIAIAGVIGLFMMPSGAKASGAARLLDWPTAASIPWDILFLFGGGLSVAAMMQSTGLSAWLGQELSFVSDFPPWLMTLCLVTFVIFFTELTSNTATIAALTPIIAAIAVQTGMDPLVLAVPVALAASCAFMLPMATGPNAVVFSSGRITMAQMARAGFKLNLLGIAAITLIAAFVIPLVA